MLVIHLLRWPAQDSPQNNVAPTGDCNDGNDSGSDGSEVERIGNDPREPQGEDAQRVGAASSAAMLISLGSKLLVLVSSSRGSFPMPSTLDPSLPESLSSLQSPVQHGYTVARLDAALV